MKCQVGSPQVGSPIVQLRCEAFS